MRVYGSSPLYNYIELIFRSKRLFILSLVIATAVTAAVAAMRSGQYTATAVVLLSGNASLPGAPDETQRGSIRYKLNVLNIVARDPDFIREAMDEKGLKQGKSDEQFADFCKRVRNALGFNSSENILEISCRWPTAQAADIVDGFYDLYSRRVLDDETVMSQQRTKLLQELVGVYEQKVKDVERQVAAYQERHTGDVLQDWITSNVNYENQLRSVQDIQNQLESARMELALLNQTIARTPEHITESTEFSSPAENPEYQRLLELRDRQRGALADVRRRYTDAHPDVVKAKEDLASTEKQIAMIEKRATAQGKIGPVSKQRVTINPAYQDLVQERSQREIGIQGIEKQLADGRQRLAAYLSKARRAPSQQFDFKWLQANYALYQGTRDNLRAKLEQAKMDELEDRELHTAEMKLEVRPQSEQDTMGVRNLIFYAAGPLLGLIIAFAFSLLAESLDHSLRTPIEVERYLGKPVLAVLPRMDTNTPRRRWLGRGEAASRSLPS